MSYYNTCPDCGAHLDPGEACDCQEIVSLFRQLPAEEKAAYLQGLRKEVSYNV